MRLDDSICGDGVLSPAEEQCDVLPTSEVDGCGDPDDPVYACKFEPSNAAKDTCPGEAVALTTAGLVLRADEGHTTLNYADDYKSSCGAEGGKDRVYAVTPDVDGTLTATVGNLEDGTPACADLSYASACFDATLYVRSACADAATELACSEIGGAAVETLSVPVKAGTPYYVVVDGYDSAYYSYGTYNLELKLTPAPQ